MLCMSRDTASWVVMYFQAIMRAVTDVPDQQTRKTLHLHIHGTMIQFVNTKSYWKNKYIPIVYKYTTFQHGYSRANCTDTEEEKYLPCEVPNSWVYAANSPTKKLCILTWLSVKLIVSRDNIFDTIRYVFHAPLCNNYRQRSHWNAYTLNNKLSGDFTDLTPCSLTMPLFLFLIFIFLRSSCSFIRQLNVVSEWSH